jgi:hypothetical protein
VRDSHVTGLYLYDKFESNSSGAIFNPLRRRGVPRQLMSPWGRLFSTRFFSPSTSQVPEKRTYGMWEFAQKPVSEKKTCEDLAFAYCSEVLEAWADLVRMSSLEWSFLR